MDEDPDEQRPPTPPPPPIGEVQPPPLSKRAQKREDKARKQAQKEAAEQAAAELAAAVAPLNQVNEPEAPPEAPEVEAGDEAEEDPEPDPEDVEPTQPRQIEQQELIDGIERLMEMIEVVGERPRPAPLMPFPRRSPVDIGVINKQNVEQMQKINDAVNVTSSRGFLDDRQYGAVLGRFSYYNDAAVGAIVCNVAVTENGIRALHIVSIAVLPKYQRLRLATDLIDYAFELSENIDDIRAIFLHVEEGNEGAMQFFTDQGFHRDPRIIPNYYLETNTGAYMFYVQV